MSPEVEVSKSPLLCGRCGFPIVGQPARHSGSSVAHAENECLQLCRARIAQLEAALPAVRRKATYVGAPAVFSLELACQHINAAFGGYYGCYLVGSALERADWRDIDVRYIMRDEEFAKLFPDANINPGTWENDPRWLLLTTSISAWLKAQTGLPVDFQIQPQTHANDRHKGPRSALGVRIGKREASE